jgi:hypothetical protein
MGYEAPWGGRVLAIDGILHNVKCKVCNTIDKTPCILAPKWDKLMKHECRSKVEKDFSKLKIKKRDYYNNKTSILKKNQVFFSYISSFYCLAANRQE